MPLFPPPHRQKIVDQFWSGGASSCPHDGGHLETHFHSQGAGYLLVIACHRCGRKAQVTRFSDPLQHVFRAWTREEISDLAEVHATGAVSACPVCHTALHCSHTITGQRLDCARCGNSAMVGEPSATTCALATAFDVKCVAC